MREILFRGKRVIDGKWVESCCPLGEMHSGTVTYDFESKTVCQYTGLTDKDGRKVFEGDIIESHTSDGQIIALNMVVRYGNYQAYCPVDEEYMDSVGFYVSASGYPDMPVGALEDYAQVIGNIFDNPELISD